jgi:hypothetical protein
MKKGLRDAINEHNEDLRNEFKIYPKIVGKLICSANSDDELIELHKLVDETITAESLRDCMICKMIKWGCSLRFLGILFNHDGKTIKAIADKYSCKRGQK